MNNSFERNVGGKSKNYRPLVYGGGLGNLAIYITTAGEWCLLLTGTKQKSLPLFNSR